MAVNGLVKVFFADGVHLIYGYEGGKYWSRKRVCVKSAYGRKRINCLGFLDAVSHKGETVMNDTYLNSDSVCEGLKKLGGIIRADGCMSFLTMQHTNAAKK